MELGPNFSPKAQFFVKQSKKLASSLNDVHVKEDHLLILILQTGDAFINSFLHKHDIDIFDYIDFVMTFASLDKGKDESQKDLEYSSAYKQILNESIKFSQNLKDDYVGIQHLYFALINHAKGSTFNFINSIGKSPQDFVNDYIRSLKMHEMAFNFLLPNDFLNKSEKQSSPTDMGALQMPQMMPAQEPKSLETYCISLNHLALKKKLPKVIGRDDEVKRICEILARKNKNNPMLIGEPGVGKTACVEGLASLIVSEACPGFLKNKEVYAVDLASMIAGTKYRGQFEQRIKNLIDEVTDTDIILFIDEAHTIIGAGGAEGAMDAANILKPALARGSIKLIAATTYPEYKKSIEKDSAFSRRFESIFINEPSPSETRKILSGIKKSYESFHKVSYSAACLDHIVSGAEKYLPSLYFPDKAIDILDEVGARLNLANSQPPDYIVDIENKIYDSYQDSKTEDEKLLVEYEEKYKKWESSRTTDITNDDINFILSRKSKLPVENIFPDSYFDVTNLESKMKRHLIGQDSAISSIAESIARSKIGLKDFKKPIGSFLLLGSTGTGKTHCAKTLAREYFGDERNFIRLDMSEFSEKVSASKLIGASPGYVGYEEGGMLIEKIKKQPHSIILFDEIEKCHPDVQQLLLQILEEGELEDNVGRKAYFHNTIIILTSNIGAHLFEKTSLGFGSESDLDREDKIKDEAVKILSPELFNRIDEAVIFHNLSIKEVKEIFKIKIKDLALRLKKQNIGLSVSISAQNLLCKKALDSKMGARPLDRVIKKEIETVICRNFNKKKSEGILIFCFDEKDGDIFFELK